MWLRNNYYFILKILRLTNYYQALVLRKRIMKMNLNADYNIPIIVDVEDYLDVYYINLNHRLDRKNMIIKEFDNIGLSKYTRLDAISRHNGALGCALSHKELLKTFDEKDGKLLMVCEDDVSFTGSNEKFRLLLSKFKNDPNLDVLCLGFNHFNEFSYDYNFYLTSDTQTMSCYIIKPYMKDILIKNFELSIQLLEQGIDKLYKPAIDQVWKLLQTKYNFVIPKDRFAIQRESFSDIEKKVVNYKV